MPDQPSDPPKKIIIDEDWKNQVQAEKEALRHEQEGSEPPPSAATDDHPLPPPGLSFLVSNLYLQAAIGLGLLPHPVSQKPEVRLAQAKHTIDLLDVLQRKTEGNRTPEETEELESVLHQLRLAYVEVQKQR